MLSALRALVLKGLGALAVVGVDGGDAQTLGTSAGLQQARAQACHASTEQAEAADAA